MANPKHLFSTAFNHSVLLSLNALLFANFAVSATENIEIPHTQRQVVMNEDMR